MGNWLFTEARRLFKTPDVTPATEIELKWEKPDEEGLVAFMCGEKGFTEDRIRNGCKKLVKSRGGATQGRLDSFFKVVPKVLPSPTSANNKRKAEDKSGSAKKKGAAGAAKKGVFKR